MYIQSCSIYWYWYLQTQWGQCIAGLELRLPQFSTRGTCTVDSLQLRLDQRIGGHWISEIQNMEESVGSLEKQRLKIRQKWLMHPSSASRIHRASPNQGPGWIERCLHLRSAPPWVGCGQLLHGSHNCCPCWVQTLARFCSDQNSC